MTGYNDYIPVYCRRCGALIDQFFPARTPEYRRPVWCHACFVATERYPGANAMDSRSVGNVTYHELRSRHHE